MNFDKIDAQVDQWILEGQNNLKLHMKQKEEIRMYFHYYNKYGILPISSSHINEEYSAVFDCHVAWLRFMTMIPADRIFTSDHFQA